MKLKLFFYGFIMMMVGCRDKEKPASAISASEPIMIDTTPGAGPFFTYDNHDRPVLSWSRIINDSTAIFCYAISEDGGKSFNKPVTIPASDNLKPHSENLPKIIFKPSGEIIALWGAANPNAANKYAGLVYYSQSFDGGRNWSEAIPLVNDTAGFDQRYYDVALMPDGEVAAIWLDNRKISGAEGSALYFAKTKGAGGFQKGKRILEGCCPCCRTDLYIGNGSMHILYRGIIGGTTRDMLHTASFDGGNSFSIPKLLSEDNWVIDGCPHTGPSMTGNADGLHFAWFTGGDGPGCYYTGSDARGEQFQPRERISEKGSHPQIVSVSNDQLLIAWDEPFIQKGVYSRRIGIGLRKDMRAEPDKLFITSDTIEASYPVITSLKTSQAGIAYTVKKGRASYVFYQRVNW